MPHYGKSLFSVTNVHSLYILVQNREIRNLGNVKDCTSNALLDSGTQLNGEHH